MPFGDTCDRKEGGCTCLKNPKLHIICPGLDETIAKITGAGVLHLSWFSTARTAWAGSAVLR